MKPKLHLYLLIGVFFLATQFVLFRLGIISKRWKIKNYLYFTLAESDIDRVCNRSTSWCPINAKAGPIKVQEVSIGGRWRPCGCMAKFRVAIIVPCMEKPPELTAFLHHMHPFLQRQQLEYTIFLVEQSQTHPFNKGALANIGFREVVIRDGYDCFIFHDSNFLPEDDRIEYACADNPRHLSAGCSSWNKKLKSERCFDGVQAFDRHQLQKVNGFSNVYFGEDGVEDDLLNRVEYGGYKVLRYPLDVAPSTKSDVKDRMLGEGRSTGKVHSNNSSQHYLLEGLNSLKYKILMFEEKPLFTHIMVELDKDAIIEHVNSLLRSAKQ